MDPSGGGGMPPPGMDPSMGMPPPPPDGGGGGDPAMTAKLDQILQALQGGAGAGAGQSGANQAGMLKPKIDVNVEIMQIKHMLAKIIDAMGIPVKAQEMVATPEKLTQMASQQQGSGQQDASMGGGPGAIPPIPPMDGSGAPGGGGGGMPKAGSYRERGAAFTYDAAAMEAVGNKAAAIARFRKQGSAASAPANGRAARDADPFDDRRSGRQRPR
jgi:hypothetical protein